MWISVKDKKPTREKHVLVWHRESGSIFIGYLLRGDKYTTITKTISGAKHAYKFWQPLPAPPKEEG